MYLAIKTVVYKLLSKSSNNLNNEWFLRISIMICMCIGHFMQKFLISKEWSAAGPPTVSEPSLYSLSHSKVQVTTEEEYKVAS